MEHSNVKHCSSRHFWSWVIKAMVALVLVLLVTRGNKVNILSDWLGLEMQSKLIMMCSKSIYLDFVVLAVEICTLLWFQTKNSVEMVAIMIHTILHRSYYKIDTSSLFGQIIFDHQRIQTNIYTQLKMLLCNWEKLQKSKMMRAGCVLETGVMLGFPG